MDLNQEDELIKFVNYPNDNNLDFASMPQSVDEGIERLNKNDADIIVNRASEKQNWGKPTYLSHGKNGYAYNLGNGKILKLTTDLSEAVESKKLLGKKNKHIADIYGIYEINYKNETYYIIILEKLKTKPELFKSYFDFLDRLFNALFSEDYYTLLMYYFNRPHLYKEKFSKGIESYFSKHNDKYIIYKSLLGIVDEQRQNNIKNSDFTNPYNLGFKPNGNIATFDIGSGNEFDHREFVGKKPEEIEIGESELINKINERIKSYVPGGKEVIIRRKCLLGGNNDGTSEPCNQGDINNLILKPIKEDENKNLVYHSSPTEINKFLSNDEVNSSLKFGKSGYYNGMYFFSDLNDAKKWNKENNYVYTLDINNLNLYDLKDSESLKKEANSNGYEYRNGSGYPESNYLDKIGYDGIKRNNEIIIFHPEKFDINLLNDINESINKRLILERTGDIEFGVLMLIVDFPNWKKITSIIKKEDIYDKEGFGIENEPHVTILYGFHDNVKADDVFDIFKAISSINPIEVTIKGISCFENDEFDVVKFDVVPTKNLKRLNRYMKELPYTNEYDEYHPHITIAYVKKGTGKNYVKTFEKERKLFGNKLIFSDVNKNKTHLNLDSDIEEIMLPKGKLLKGNINESTSDYDKVKKSLMNSKSIPEEMKNKQNYIKLT